MNASLQLPIRIKVYSVRRYGLKLTSCFQYCCYVSSLYFSLALESLFCKHELVKLNNHTTFSLFSP